jgi:CRISPR-associated exonuclease Cas4
MSKLVSFNSQALQLIDEENTKSLDDFSRPRSKMATASEICSCQRRVKLKMESPSQPTAKELRQKRRGHLFELDQAERFRFMGFREVKREAFPASRGTCFARQVVVEHPLMPIGAHLDFLIRHKDDSLHVIECKTTDGIPDEPYCNWVDQLHLQLGLVANAFPGAQIRGSILVADLSAGEEREFNSFAPDILLTNYLFKKGRELVEVKAGKRTPGTSPGILCGHCPYRPGCPAHGDQVIPQEVNDRVAQYEDLDRLKKDIEKRLKPMKQGLIDFFGGPFQGVTEDGISLAITYVNDSEILDSQELKKNLPEVFKSYSKPKAGYAKLEVKRLPPPPLAQVA